MLNSILCQVRPSWVKRGGVAARYSWPLRLREGNEADQNVVGLHQQSRHPTRMDIRKKYRQIAKMVGLW